MSNLYRSAAIPTVIRSLVTWTARSKHTKTGLAALTIALASLTSVIGQPVITGQPTNQSVSLGASVTFQVTASGAAPLSYQWRFNDIELLSATSRTLVLTNVQPNHADNYAAVVTNLSGSVTSKVATLEVDPTFTKITTGPVVTDLHASISAAWGDYDNDGFIDLVVGEEEGPTSLYHNNGDGTSTKVISGTLVRACPIGAVFPGGAS